MSKVLNSSSFVEGFGSQDAQVSAHKRQDSSESEGNGGFLQVRSFLVADIAALADFRVFGPLENIDLLQKNCCHYD